MAAINAENVGGAPGDVLPEFWPERPVPPIARAWWIPWPVAVLLVPLLWLMPKRMGPHFAAVRWPGVIIGHLCWTLYGIASIDLAGRASNYGWVAWLMGKSPGQANPAIWPPPGAGDIFAAPLALEARWLGEVITSNERFLLAWGVLLGGELGVILMGLLIMPYLSVGERIGWLAGRSVKLALWATTSLVLLAMVLQAVALGWAWSPHLRTAETLALCGYAMWLLWAWRRSGSVYWGPAEGPGWERHRPNCEECGYILTGRSAADVCPECGRPVEDSLPKYRSPAPWAAARGLKKIPAFGVTAYRVLMDTSFADQLAMDGAHAQARGFAVRMCLLAAAMSVVAAMPMPGIILDEFLGAGIHGGSGWREVAAPLVAGIILFVVGSAIISIVTFVGTAWARRPLDSMATIVFLHSMWFIPLGIVAAWAAVCGLEIAEARLHDSERSWWIGVEIVILVFLGFLTWEAVGSLVRSMRQTRFANA